MSKLTKKIIAMLLSGILVLGSATSSVLAASIDLDPNQTSEIAEEVYDKDTSEAPAGAGESYPEEASANEEAVEYYTVTLDANGGYFEHEWDDVLEETVENTEVLNKTIPFGGIVEIVPVKDSATFLGWRLELDGEVLGAEYAPKENCTLYAAWQMEDGVIEGETTGVVPAVDEVPAEEGDPVEDVIEEELPAEEADGQETIDEGDVQEEEFVDDFEQFDAEQDTEVAAESETDELDPTQDAETAEVEETDAQYNAEGTAQIGMIEYTDSNGNKNTGLGGEVSVGAEAYVAKGRVSGGIKVFGVQIDLGVTGKALDVGGTAGVKYIPGKFKGKIGAGLGLGAELDISIDWSKAAFPDLSFLKFW